MPEQVRQIIEQIKAGVIAARAQGVECYMPEWIMVDGVRYEVVP